MWSTSKGAMNSLIDFRNAVKALGKALVENQLPQGGVNEKSAPTTNRRFFRPVKLRGAL